MLYQLHWQFRDGKTEMIQQFELKDGASDNSKHRKIREMMDDANKSHPLPDKAQWMLCSEKSEHFVMIAADK